MATTKAVRMLGIGGNEVVLARAAEVTNKAVMVYFGGDLQTFTDAMTTNSRELTDTMSVIARDFNLEATVTELCSSLETVIDAVVGVHPSRMVDGFSHFDQFVSSQGNQGSPHYDKSEKSNDKRALTSLNDLLKALKIEDETKIEISGFSKGVGVINQLLYDLALNEGDEVVKQMSSRLRRLVFLDGGHNGSDEVYLTSPLICNYLAKIGARIELRLTSYQLDDEHRPWIRRQEAKFVNGLRERGVDVRRKIFFQDEICDEQGKRRPRSNLFMHHFRVLHTFRDLPVLERTDDRP